MPATPTRIGLISDTHGLLRPQALEALRGSEIILHAGDIGTPQILDALKALAPVVAVRGNMDTSDWARTLPKTAIATTGAVLIYLLHDLHTLDLAPASAGFHIVVSGHSHQPGQHLHDGVLYINPGSAGPRRFRLPVSLARLRVERTPFEVEFVTLED